MLGWQTTAENKDIIYYQMNGILFSLFDRKGLASGAGVSDQGEGFHSFTFAYNVNSRSEVDELFDEMKAKGVEVLKEPQDTPFGSYFFYFADPEGNVLEVAYNPYIPLDNEGNTITHYHIDDV